MRFATAGRDLSIRIYDTTTGQVRETDQQTDRLTAGRDLSLRIYDTTTGQEREKD